VVKLCTGHQLWFYKILLVKDYYEKLNQMPFADGLDLSSTCKVSPASFYQLDAGSLVNELSHQGANELSRADLKFYWLMSRGELALLVNEFEPRRLLVRSHKPRPRDDSSPSAGTAGGERWRTAAAAKAKVTSPTTRMSVRNHSPVPSGALVLRLLFFAFRAGFLQPCFLEFDRAQGYLCF